MLPSPPGGPSNKPWPFPVLLVVGGCCWWWFVVVVRLCGRAAWCLEGVRPSILCHTWLVSSSGLPSLGRISARIPCKGCRPDVVPPSPILECERSVSANGSGSLAEPSTHDDQSKKAWLPYSNGKGGQRLQQIPLLIPLATTCF